MIKPRAKKGWAIVNKKTEKLDLEDIHSSRDGFVLQKNEKWLRVEVVAI